MIKKGDELVENFEAYVEVSCSGEFVHDHVGSLQ